MAEESRPMKKVLYVGPAHGKAYKSAVGIAEMAMQILAAGGKRIEIEVRCSDCVKGPNTPVPDSHMVIIDEPMPLRSEPSAFSEKVKIITMVAESMAWDQDKATVWYETPNPQFGGASAKEMVERGRGFKVIQFIENAKDEITPTRKGPA